MHKITELFRRVSSSFALMLVVLAPAFLSMTFPRVAHAVIDVWIDPGHGGTDPGNLGFDGPGVPNEKDITLAVSLDLQNSLAGLALEAHLTHTTDDSLSLRRRGLIANGLQANDENVQDSCVVFVSIHTNANNDASIKGTETYFWRSKKDKSVFSPGGRALADTVHSNMIGSFAAAFGAPFFCHSDRGVKSENFAVIRESHSPGILIELCFQTNQCQENLIASSSKQAVVADGVATGLQHWFASLGPEAPPARLPGTGHDGRVSTAVPTSSVIAGTSQVGASSIETPSRAIATGLLSTQVVSFQEGFDGASFPPLNWTVQTAGAPVPHTWYRETNAPAVNSGAGAAFVQGAYGSAADEWLISPHVKVASTDQGLSFFWSGNQTWASAVNATCNIRIVGSSTWTPAWSLLSEPTADPFIYRQRVIDLTPYLGDSIQFAFRVQGTDGADFGVDDVAVGDFTATSAPGNDHCGGATPLAAGPFSIQGVTCYASNDWDPSGMTPSCVSDELGGPDVLYSMNATAGDTLSAAVSGEWNPAVYLLNACNTASPTCVAGGYSVEAGIPPGFTYIFAATGTYYLVVDGPNGSCGPFTLSGSFHGPTAGVGPATTDGLSRVIVSALPNPSAGSIHFAIGASNRVGGVGILRIYDLSGRRVLERLVPIVSGRGAAVWDARDLSGAAVPSGVYLAAFSVGGEQGRTRVTVVK